MGGAGFHPSTVWVWVKIKPPGDRLSLSWVPFTRVPCWVPIVDPQPYGPEDVSTRHTKRIPAKVL